MLTRQHTMTRLLCSAVRCTRSARPERVFIERPLSESRCVSVATGDATRSVGRFCWSSQSRINTRCRNIGPWEYISSNGYPASSATEVAWIWITNVTLESPRRVAVNRTRCFQLEKSCVRLQTCFRNSTDHPFAHFPSVHGNVLAYF